MHDGRPHEVPFRVVLDAPADRQRVDAAVVAAVKRFLPWFGPRGGGPITTEVRLETAVETQPTFALESRVVAAVARWWWRDTLHPEAGDLAHGLAAYLSGIVVEDLVDVEHRARARGIEAAPLFGGALRWSFRGLRFSRAVPLGPGPAVERVELALLTLERHLGWTMMERGLAAAARRLLGTEARAVDVVEALGDASGRDLSWFSHEVFSAGQQFDYAVESLSDERVTVVRHGGGVFSGTSRRPLGHFDAGDAMILEVRFADGQRLRERWDGRDRERVFEYAAPAPIVAAVVDPDHVLVLDRHRRNNVMRGPAESRVPLVRWMARWTAWLQSALLTAGAVL